MGERRRASSSFGRGVLPEGGSGLERHADKPERTGIVPARRTGVNPVNPGARSGPSPPPARPPHDQRAGERQRRARRGLARAAISTSVESTGVA